MEEKFDLKVEKIENYLDNKKIALCVTGGIAAIETPKIARHLRRYGAEVKAYATPNSLKFIGEAALEWATEKKVICELSGLAEHICLEDLVLVAPATLNTINKVMYGIADNTVTSLIASALGNKIPVYMAPTMHGSLYNNPIFQENLSRSKKYGIHMIEPRFSEGKAKIPNVRKITSEIIEYFRSNDDINKQA